MKFSQNGYDFTDEWGIVPVLNRYCKEKKINAKVFMAEKGEYKTFVLFNIKGEPIYESQKAEDISCHIDMMALAKQ